MGTDEITAHVQQLVDSPNIGHGGYIGQAIVKRLPNMQQCHPHASCDFLFIPSQSKIEVKWGLPVEIYSAGGCTYQARWNNIRPERFDCLILSTLHEGELYLWLMPSFIAEGFRTPSMSGTIRYTLPPFYRARTVKAERLDCYRASFDNLHARCLQGALFTQ